MCIECGCGLPGETPAGINAHSPEHEHDHPHGSGHAHTHEHEHPHGPGVHHDEEPAAPHSHGHSHEHGHGHTHSHEPEPEARRTVEVRRAILEKNDRLAERNRGFFRARGLLVLNVLSSPGSGKTTLLRETIRFLAPELRSGVVVGDLATDNDARRLRESGAPVVQVTTGTVCHLDAEMVARAVRELDLNGLNLLIIENVGNLVCPASYDLGEAAKLVMLSVAEGDDKPLKYPAIFFKSELVVINKIDLLPYVPFDLARAEQNARKVHPGVEIIRTSCTAGQGLDAWLAWLAARLRAARTRTAESGR